MKASLLALKVGLARQVFDFMVPAAQGIGPDQKDKWMVLSILQTTRKQSRMNRRAKK
jgi:hypothetical protein